MRIPGGLGGLRPSLCNIPVGTWWWLRDADTRFGDRAGHPWILHVAFNARLEFGHACPRTTLEPRDGDTFVKHGRHRAGHEESCKIDREPAWIKPLESRQILAEWIDNGGYSCEERDLAFLGKVELALQDAGL